MYDDTLLCTRRDHIELFIAYFCVQHFGNFPSFREIARVMGMSLATVRVHLRSLQREGRVHFLNHTHGYLPGSTYIPPVRLARLIEQGVLYQTGDGILIERRGFQVGVLRQLYKDQRGLCYWCQQELLGIYEIDHVIPLAHGGHDVTSNICLACLDCNKLKSDKSSLDVFGR